MLVVLRSRILHAIYAANLCDRMRRKRVACGAAVSSRCEIDNKMVSGEPRRSGAYKYTTVQAEAACEGIRLFYALHPGCDTRNKRPNHASRRAYFVMQGSQRRNEQQR